MSFSLDSLMCVKEFRRQSDHGLVFRQPLGEGYAWGPNVQGNRPKREDIPLAASHS